MGDLIRRERWSVTILAVIVGLWAASERWSTGLQTHPGGAGGIGIGQNRSRITLAISNQPIGNAPVLFFHNPIEQGDIKWSVDSLKQYGGRGPFPIPATFSVKGPIWYSHMLFLPHWLILLLAIVTRLAFFFAKRSSRSGH